MELRRVDAGGKINSFKDGGGGSGDLYCISLKWNRAFLHARERNLYSKSRDYGYAIW